MAISPTTPTWGRHFSGRTTATSASRPFLLALYGGAREWRRPLVAFLIVATVVAFFFVLGSATPVFRAAYLLLPGMNVFRFPTRFLIVVELGLALLGAIGLTRLGADLNRRWHDSPRVAQLIVIAVCAGTVLDLFIHQPRQNPMVPARDWLAAPPTVGVVRADTGQPRTFTPRHSDLHRRTFLVARGWAGRRCRTSSFATCSNRTPVGASGTCRQQTATRASRRAGIWTCGAITIARLRSSLAWRGWTSRRGPCTSSRCSHRS